MMSLTRGPWRGQIHGDRKLGRGRGWGGGEVVCDGGRVSVWEDEQVLEMMVSDDCTTM